MTIQTHSADQARRQLAGESVAAMARNWSPGGPLVGDFYTSNQVFDHDLEVIFGRHWFFATTEAHVREAGDYITLDFGPISLLVLRDDDEQVQAFHNVCRHRGAKILSDEQGVVGNLVCGYHYWTYSTGGKLLHAPGAEDDFDPACFALKNVAVKVVGGLIYLCLASDPPTDINSMAERIEPYLQGHQLARTKVAAQQDIIETGNWKLVMENNRECYHCEGHPELSSTFFLTYGLADDEVPTRLRPAHDRYLLAESELELACSQRGLRFERIEELVEPATAFRIQREALDGVGESFSLDGRLLCQRLMGDLDMPRLGRLSMHLQPNAWFHFMSDHAVTFAVFPLGPDRTLVRTTWLVHEEAVEGVDYDIDTLTYVWRETNAQDSEFVARAQRGVSSPAYQPGPYMRSEYQVEAFVRWYLRRLEAHDTGAI